MKQIEEIFTELDSGVKTIAITTHQKPDGDAMGSSLALYHFLTTLGHHVQVISPTNWAYYFDWMPGVEKVWNYEKSKEISEEFLKTADLLFCLDFNAASRVKNMEASISTFEGVKVLIDHHQQPEIAFFDYGYSVPEKSSTCEMIFDFIEMYNKVNMIDQSIAECIYTGMVTDTGSFKYSSTTSRVHDIASYLLQKDINHIRIHNNLFDNNNENRLRFLGHILSNRMEFFYEYNAALIRVSKDDLVKYEIKTGETEGLVNYPLSISGIKLAALVIDRDEERKWSFRSKSDFDCSTFARNHFNGGGHFNAAGGNDKNTLSDTIKKFKEVVPQYKDQLMEK
ncbi:MAG: bifunctional oligoribonuclease/PAP phosphatase NrnA [Chitinophagaceae bacterium]|nr:MAG: bifunctional oligoribonuclease/PAP phosphatase NrnA [Chitinophagaceae bacterium]